MKKFLSHVAPVLLALGLWLVGNSLATLQPAKGDTEVAKAYRKCYSKDKQIGNALCSVRIKGKCGTGNCEGYIIHNKRCGQAFGPNPA